jgi:hypothetical protein
MSTGSAACGKETQKDKVRATMLLSGERGRKEEIDDPSCSSERSTDSLPLRTRFKSTAQAMNHAT